MKILVWGQRGQIAHELKRSLARIENTRFVGSDEVSFSNPNQVISIMREHRPTHVINAAAYTAVDKAEAEKAKAFIINAETVGAIAEEAKSLRIPLFHYSTDYVFDGLKSGPYTELDSANPLSVYGQTKLQGENYIQQSDCDYIILRISWIYGNHGNNFYKTMLRIGNEKEEIKVVSDQVGAPTWSRNVAEATRIIISDKNVIDKKGLYHFTDGGEASWFNFAYKIFELCRRMKPDSYQKLKRVLPIDSSQYLSAAKRPLNSRMSSEKIKATFEILQRPWEQSLEDVLEEC